MRLRLRACRGRAVHRPLKLGPVDAQRHLALREEVLPDRARPEAASADGHVQALPARHDDLGDAARVGAGAAPPEPHGRAADAEVPVAVDDGDDEARGPRELRQGRLAAHGRHGRAPEVARRARGLPPQPAASPALSAASP